MYFAIFPMVHLNLSYFLLFSFVSLYNICLVYIWLCVISSVTLLPYNFQFYFSLQISLATHLLTVLRRGMRSIIKNRLMKKKEEMKNSINKILVSFIKFWELILWIFSDPFKKFILTCNMQRLCVCVCFLYNR